MTSVFSVVKKAMPRLIVFALTAVLITLLWLLLVDWPGFQQWVIVYNRAPLDATLTAVAAQNGPKIITFLLSQWPLLLLAAAGCILPLLPHRLPITDHRSPITDYPPKGRGRRNQSHKLAPVTSRLPRPYHSPIIDHRSPITDYRLPITVCLLWLAAATVTLYTLQPMWEHYLLFLLYPLLLLASGGMVTAVNQVNTETQRHRAEIVFVALLFILFAAVNLATPRDWGEWPPGYAEAAATLRQTLEPGGFMLTDEPFLAFEAGQLVAPTLADSSTKRIATSLLQPTDVINAQLEYGVRVGLWGNGRFQQLPSLTTWADSAATSQTDLGGLTLYEFGPLTPTIPLHAQLEPGIQLRGYTLHPALTDQTLQITLFWAADSPLPADYKILLHLLDESGQPLTQADGDPMGGWLPTTAWKPGVLVPHTAVLPLPLNATPPYTLATGLYTWPDLARLPAFQADGSRWPNDLIIVTNINP